MDALRRWSIRPDGWCGGAIRVSTAIRRSPSVRASASSSCRAATPKRSEKVAALAELLRVLGTRQTMELIITVAHYNAVSRILESARVPIEEGWALDPGEFAPRGPIFLWVTTEPKDEVWERLAPHVRHQIDSYAGWTADAYGEPQGPFVPERDGVALDLDHAHPAGAEARQLGLVAEGRDLDAVVAADLEDGLAHPSRERPAVDLEVERGEHRVEHLDQRRDVGGRGRHALGRVLAVQLAVGAVHDLAALDLQDVGERRARALHLRHRVEEPDEQHEAHGDLAEQRRGGRQGRGHQWILPPSSSIARPHACGGLR